MGSVSSGTVPSSVFPPVTCHNVSLISAHGLQSARQYPKPPLPSPPPAERSCRAPFPSRLCPPSCPLSDAPLSTPMAFSCTSPPPDAGTTCSPHEGSLCVVGSVLVRVTHARVPSFAGRKHVCRATRRRFAERQAG